MSLICSMSQRGSRQLVRKALAVASPVAGRSIEHQLYLAEVTNRLQPRVLLADEVGLGKTIEACLILHRLYLTGRAERALIISGA